MAGKVRVTHRTDTRGTLNADNRGLYAELALKAASAAGVPGDLLDPAGWNGDPNDLQGYFAEQIYLLSEVGWTRPDTIERISEIIAVMVGVCRHYDVDPKAAIPYGQARLFRELHESRERVNARHSGEPVPSGFSAEASAAYDAQMDEWGCPSGPAHDGHGHGLSDGVWKCLA